MSGIPSKSDEEDPSQVNTDRDAAAVSHGDGSVYDNEAAQLYYEDDEETVEEAVAKNDKGKGKEVDASLFSTCENDEETIEENTLGPAIQIILPRSKTHSKVDDEDSSKAKISGSADARQG